MKFGVVVTNTETNEEFLLYQLYNFPSKESFMMTIMECPELLDIPEEMMHAPFKVVTPIEISNHYASLYSKEEEWNHTCFS